MSKIPAINGSISKGILISKKFAKKNNLKVGEQIEIGSYLGESITEKKKVPIIAIVPNLIDGNDVYVDWDMPLFTGEKLMIDKIMVETTNVDEALKQLEDLKQSLPELQIMNKEILLKQSKEMFYQRWSLFIGVFMILISATCLGILQSLMSSIYSKRGDYAIQRLMGLSPNQLIKLIVTQVLTFILYGLVLGTFIGIVFTKMLALIDRNSTLTIDFVALGSVSLTFFFSTILVISIQGYWISRRRLVDELI